MNYRLPLAAAACALAACSSTRQTSEPIGTSTARLSGGLVISQIYPGGGNAGATYRSDYVEIFNRGSTAVALAGMSIQNRGSGSTWSVYSFPAATPALQPGKYYLVQMFTGTTGAVLPVAPDDVATGSALINFSATASRVALVSNQTALTCSGDCLSVSSSDIIDLVGLGAALDFEGTAAPSADSTHAVIRRSNGCVETDNNAADFVLGTPNPRNNSSSAFDCSAVDAGARDAATDAASDAGAPDSGTSSGGAGTGGTGGASTGGASTGGIGGASTGGASTGGTGGASTGGASTGGAATGGTAGSGFGGSSAGGSSSGGTGGDVSVGGSATGGTSSGGTGGTGVENDAGLGGTKSTDSGDSGGCGCSIPGSKHAPRGAGLVALLGLALVTRRRRKWRPFK